VGLGTLRSVLHPIFLLAFEFQEVYTSLCGLRLAVIVLASMPARFLIVPAGDGGCHLGMTWGQVKLHQVPFHSFLGISPDTMPCQSVSEFLMCLFTTWTTLLVTTPHVPASKIVGCELIIIFNERLHPMNYLIYTGVISSLTVDNRCEF